MILLGRSPPQNSNSRKVMRGMTLVELIVTISIVAIVTTLAVPSFRQMLRKNRVDGLTNELGASLNLVRSEAIKRGKRVTVCKTADPSASSPACSSSASVPWQTGWIAFVDEGMQGTVDGSDIRLKVNQPNESTATIGGGDNYADYISYLPSGVSNVNGGEADGTFTICMEGVQRRIVISPIGRINVKPEETC